MTDPREYASDLRSAARTIRGSSWPLEMGEWAEQLANRLDSYAASGSPTRVGLAAESLDVGTGVHCQNPDHDHSHLVARDIDCVPALANLPEGSLTITIPPCTCGPAPNDGRYDDPACPHHGHPEGGVSSVTEAPPREDVVVRLQDAVAAAHYSGASSVTVDLPTGDDLLRLLAAAGPMPEEVAELDRLYTETKQRLLRLVAENWGSDFTNPEIGGCMAECAYLDAAELAGWLAEHISEMCDHRPAVEAPQPRVLWRCETTGTARWSVVPPSPSLDVPSGTRIAVVVEDPAGAEEADDAPG